MTSSHRHTRDALPLGAVRDLLGIARALYRAELAGAGDPVRLEELRRVGEHLKTALELATKVGPGTLGHSAAWSHAEQAVEALGALVADGTTVASTLPATAARVRRR